MKSRSTITLTGMPKTIAARVVAAFVAAVALVLVSALPANAATYDSFSGTINSRPAGAYAENSPYEQTIVWTGKTKVAVHSELHDNRADGNGATLQIALNYYNSSGYFVGQKVAEKRNTKGAGTELYVNPSLQSPPSDAVKAKLTVTVCNGKTSDGRNENCGDSQYFNP